MLYKVKTFTILHVLSLIISGLACAQSGSLTVPEKTPQLRPIQLAQASGSAPISASDAIAELNANTVTIISGNPNGTYLYLAYDLSAALDNGNKLRILPVIGKGGAQNVKDVLYLKGIDMGITQSNLLAYYDRTGEAGRNISDRLRYITRLYNEELHVLVSPDINTVEDLRSKTINFSDIGSGTQLSTQLIFDLLGISVNEVNMGQADAFEALRRKEISATFLVAGKPSGAFAKLESEPASYKLLNFPYAEPLQESFLPATFTHDDYPKLIPQGQSINSISASAVLAVYNWPADRERYRRVAKFTEAFFKNFDKLLEKPRHPKWKEVNLAAELPGWTRFVPAQELLNKAPIADSRASQRRLKNRFTQFLGTLPPSEAGPNVLTEDRREELFRKFLEWQGAE